MSFHKERKAFVIIGTTPIFMKDGDVRTCHDWCMDDLNINGAAWDTVIRGYVKGSDLVFFTGGDTYNPVTDLSPDIIENVLHELQICPDDVRIYNGVRPFFGRDVTWPRVFIFDFYNQKWELCDE